MLYKYICIFFSSFSYLHLCLHLFPKSVYRYTHFTDNPFTSETFFHFFTSLNFHSNLKLINHLSYQHTILSCITACQKCVFLCFKLPNIPISVFTHLQLLKRFIIYIASSARNVQWCLLPNVILWNLKLLYYYNYFMISSWEFVGKLYISHLSQTVNLNSII